MKDERIESMDPELASALRRGVARTEAPEGAGGRLTARLAASIPGFDGGGGGGPDGAEPSAPATSPVAAAPAATGAASKLAGTALLAFALGGGAGVLGTIAALSPNERIVYVERAPAAPSAIAAPAPPGLTTVRVEDLPIAASAAAPVRSAEPSAAPASSSQLVAERQTLDEARAAFMRGDFAGALTIADRHEHDFPHGALAEEREALAIRALAALGRAGDAHARAARFRARYPRSLMLPAVEAAIERD